MKLSVLERLLVMGLLPRESNFTNLKILRVAREALSFNDEENGLLNFRMEGEQTRWNNDVIVFKDSREIVPGDPEEVFKMIQENPELYDRKPLVDDKEIKIGEIATQLIVAALKKLNETEKLTEQHFSLYEKFVDPGPGIPEALQVVH